MDPKNFMGRPKTFTSQTEENGMFREFDATELYCPKCKRPVPVRKRLLLVLPEGDKYEYLCGFCAESVGSKIDRHVKPPTVII
jgi:hypothetical protein